jgi:hypothetical protein
MEGKLYLCDQTFIYGDSSPMNLLVQTCEYKTLGRPCMFYASSSELNVDVLLGHQPIVIDKMPDKKYVCNVINIKHFTDGTIFTDKNGKKFIIRGTITSIKPYKKPWGQDYIIDSISTVRPIIFLVE